MEIQTIKDRPALEKYFRRNLPLHLYSLGDLDDVYWPRTICYGTRSGNALKNIATFYRGKGLPVLLVFGKFDHGYLGELQSLLPDCFYIHSSPGLIEHFSENNQIREYGDHYKMALENYEPIHTANTENTFQITKSDLPEVNQLYQASYPDNAFDASTLDSGQYIGIRHQGKLVSIAGIHIYSTTYQVASLGNITTHPDYRSQGFGKAVTARLCLLLERTVDFIGLHVKCDNRAAIALYESLGFRISSVYGEFSLQNKQK